MIWSAVIFFAVLAIDLFTDLRLFFKRKPVNHTRGLILRLIGLAPSVYLLPHDRIIGAALEGMLYLTLFNGIWGLVTGNGWFYIGDTARVDRFMRGGEPWSYLIQYTLLIGLILMYFI